MIASLLVGMIVGVTVYAAADRIINRRRRAGWPASTAPQVRRERKRSLLNLNDTNHNRWSNHR